MWIKTKLKNALCDVSAVHIQQTDFSDCYVLEGLVTGSDKFFILGEYETYEEAEKKLNEIEKSMSNVFVL